MKVDAIVMLPNESLLGFGVTAAIHRAQDRTAGGM
jgi:hypothetical protein